MSSITSVKNYLVLFVMVASLFGCQTANQSSPDNSNPTNGGPVSTSKPKSQEQTESPPTSLSCDTATEKIESLTGHSEKMIAKELALTSTDTELTTMAKCLDQNLTINCSHSECIIHQRQTYKNPIKGKI
jgi:hypothetical protein